MRLERIKSIDVFKNLQDRLITDYDPDIPCFIISAGTCGQASGANELIRLTKRELLAKNLVDKIDIRITGCHGFCEMEPSVLVEPRRTFYPRVKPNDMTRIVAAVAKGEILEDLFFVDQEIGKPVEKQDESCGKCFTCRKGTQRMYEVLEDITKGKGTFEHLELLEELAYVVKDTTMCGLGQTAPNPVLSTLRYFRDEFMEHIQNKHCPAGVCNALIIYSIKENCTGCQVCLRACPENAISGEKKILHIIDQDKCVKCGACFSVCKFEAVDVE